MKQIKKNFIYNALYQMLILILPFITVPYVSRILGTTGVGIYSYTYSIVYYFMLIGMLGINNYGNRTIAKSRDNKKLLSQNFLSIYFLQLIMNMIMIIFYLIYICVINNQYKLISAIQIIYLISNMFDINWFFFGLEKFKLTVTRNTIIKFISLILIFIFVKDTNDLWIYVLILSLSTLISQLLLFPFLAKEVKFEKIKFKDLKKHIKPCLILFIPVIAISLYKVMDKIMIGIFSNMSEVGFYEQAEKIINLPLGIITSLGTVMLPRISNLVEKGKDEEILEYIKISINFMMFLAFPIVFGLCSISDKFIPLFLGEDFFKSSILIYLLCPTIVFIAFANVIRTQYLIPKEKDKIYITSVIIGAIINLFLNIIFIPNYGSIGACFGTLGAEFFVMFYQSFAVRREISIKDYLYNCIPFLVKSIVMFIILVIINLLKISDIILIILNILIGTIIYFILNYKFIKKYYIKFK